jgi:hypothetical protein
MAHYQPWQIYAMQKLTTINFLIASFDVNDKDEIVADKIYSFTLDTQ